MSYQVLARKWRPQTFSEVVGQDHIARTLRNAILTNRIGHAYLFVGSRGIGKTTSARIFAKALNCANPVGGEPCCKCESCTEISSGSSIDVIEMDAASHNGVDDIRRLQELVTYPPQKGRYKIFIIDEVHMLSNAAWNAFLKTLEEPPDYVKFIFATTEPHKLLPTIISRCQRFDLRRIPVPLIMGRLRTIADNEGIFIDDGALACIARAADGGMRDAQSIMDTVIAFCGGTSEAETIHEQDVIDIFGLAGGRELKAIAAGILANDLPATLEVVARLADAGRDLERVFSDLVEYFRNLMVASTCAEADKFLQLSPDELAEIKELAHQTPPQLVRRTLAALASQQKTFGECLNKRIALEVVVAQIIGEIHSTDLDDVLTHLNVISGLIPREEIAPRVPLSLKEPLAAAVAPPVASSKEPPRPAPAVSRPADSPPEPAPPPPEPVREIPAAPQPVQEPPPEAADELEDSCVSPVNEELLLLDPVEDSTLGEKIVAKAPEQPEVVPGYRRASSAELEELKKNPTVKAATDILGVAPYDAVIPQ